MRWPLKLQIGMPMACIMLAAICTASGLNAYFAAVGVRGRLEERFRDIAAIVRAANFPLTPNVLGQLRQLTGAHYLLLDPHGALIASTLPQKAILPHPGPAWFATHVANHRVPVQVAGEGYLPIQVQLRPSSLDASSGTLQILYPLEEYEAAWKTAVFPSLGVLLVSLPAAVGLAVATAAGVGRRIRALRDHLRRIAGGDFTPAAVPRRNDELRDLARDLNQAAGMLAGYEERIRRTERMQTLGLLGGAVAHQLRNSVTGCRLALNFHREDCPLAPDDESLAVAIRQLDLMEEYVRRFLQRAHPGEGRRHDVVDLADVVSEVLELLAPVARHTRIEVAWSRPQQPCSVLGDRADLGQLVTNLVFNAIEASGRSPAGTEGPRRIEVECRRGERPPVRLTVSNNGPPPSHAVRDSLFEPFVSEKAGGVGLGLSVVRTIVAQHGGDVSWEHDAGWTRFHADFPDGSADGGAGEPSRGAGQVASLRT